MDDSELLWGVGAVAERLGLASPTLRTWERRYGIGPSRRTTGGHRRYNETDICRVELMNRIVSSGVPAQSAARVALSLDPQGLVAALAAETTGEDAPSHVVSTPHETVEQIVRAGVDLDAVGLAAVVSETVREWGVTGAWVNVLQPALGRLDDDVRDGVVGDESLLMVRERLESELRGVARDFGARSTGSRPLLLAATDDDARWVEVLALEAALAGNTIAAVGLGPGVGGATLARAADRLQPAAIYLWAGEAGGADRVAALPTPAEGLTVVLGGPGWGTVPEAPPGVVLEHGDDLPATTRQLVDLVTRTTTLGAVERPA